jgi:hypothetical protein
VLSETSVPTYQTAQYKAKEHSINLYHCQNLESYTSIELLVFSVWVVEVNVLIYCTCRQQNISLTFNVWIFKLLGTCCGQNLNGRKSLKLQTFRKNYTFSILCDIEIRTKNGLKDNTIFYTYTKEQIIKMKILCDYFVMKCKISSLLYIYYEIQRTCP